MVVTPLYTLNASYYPIRDGPFRVSSLVDTMYLAIIHVIDETDNWLMYVVIPQQASGWTAWTLAYIPGSTKQV